MVRDIRAAAQFLLPITVLLFAAACGGGGGGSDSPPPTTNNPPTTPPPTPTTISLSSDAGEYIGGGRDYSYTRANAEISVSVNAAHLAVTVAGDESWTGNFQLPDTYTQIEAGTFTNLARYPFHMPAVGGMDWSGEGRGCNTLTGAITISNVVYDGTELVEFDLEFEQYCENAAPGLRGTVHFDASDDTSPPGPAQVPAGLWEPPAGALPADGGYVYLESQPGDYIGAGGTYTYTPNTALISTSATDGHLSIAIEGDERWTGDFQAMNVVSVLEAGYYGDLQRYPFHNPVKGGLSWSGEGRGCNTLTGWFVIDSVTYDGGALAAIELRFEQHCEGGGPALNGAIRWDVNDTATLGPVVPPPAGLWAPATGATPESGSYVYLESEPGDYIGIGGTYLYTQRDSRISHINSAQNEFVIWVEGSEFWQGDFAAMESLARLEVGYYGNLQRAPFHNPVRGGLNWSGEGRGCNMLSGWFVIDHLVYDGSTLIEIDLRFEQYCDGNSAALRGAIHWDANDTTAPPGPVVPAPAGLWAPAPGITPDTGNFVYLESEPGDWLGQGQSYLYTAADALFQAVQSDSTFVIQVHADEDWGGSFRPMYTLGELEVGYYPDQDPNNPAKGAMNWGGMGRGCNVDTGWFVVDRIEHDQGTVTAIELRFEYHCEGAAPALHGQIRWDADDTTRPPGPVVPPPPGLWEPPVDAVPATGNYVYLESEPFDYIGQGGTYLYTSADSLFSTITYDRRFNITVTGDEGWRGNFEAMYNLPRLEVGYYGNLRRYPFHNPARGGLSWSGEGRGCNSLTGWFVVDSITYEGDAITAIEMRFEQHCEGREPALNGEIHWSIDDTGSSPGPVVPIPDGLWEPPAGAVPGSGDFVYLEGEPGDYISAGNTYLYTPANAQFTLDALTADFSVHVDGSESWYGGFEAMSNLDLLEVGYYPSLRRFPFHNPARGGLTWYGEGRGCNNLTGWFVVDSVTYDAAVLTDIELRFEQYCDASPGPLHGKMRLSR